MNRLIFLVSLLISLITTTLASSRNVSVQLQWLHQFQFAGFYMAKEKGFYKQKDLNVSIKQLSQDMHVLDEVLEGRSDFGLGRSSLLIEKANGKPIVALASILQSSPLVLISTNENIKSVRDLRERKIMIVQDDIVSAPLVSMLISQGINLEKVQQQRHSFTLDDLINNKTDAMACYISNEPFTLKKQKVPFTIFNPKDFGFDFYDEILFTTKDLVKKDPQLVKDFRDATLEGWEYAFKHIEETANFIYKNYNFQKKSLDNLLYEGHTLKKLAFEGTSTIGNIDPIKLQEINKVYQLSQLQNTKLDTKDFLDPYNNLKKNVNIGILAKLGSTISIKNWYSLATYLNSALPMYNFKVTPYLFEEMEQAIKFQQVDFILTNPMHYVQLEYKYSLSPMASMKNESTDLPRGVTKFGAVIFTKANNKNINTLEDLQNHPFGAVSKQAFGGWLMAKKELKDNNLDYNTLNAKFFNTHDGVVKAVLNGEIAAGTARTETLEKMANKGEINLTDIKIINPKYINDFPYLLSTQLYPQWPFAKLKHTPERLANAVLSALLKQSFAHTQTRDNAYSWSIPMDYSKVHQVLQELKVYPYETTNFTFKEVLDKYLPWFISGIFISFIILITLFYIQTLNKQLAREVKKRTKELTNANEKLQKLANIDELTGISNRRDFLAKLEKSILYSQRYYTPLAFLSIDIDYFKNVNDTYGHDIGDKVLKHIVNNIKDSIRNSDHFGRLGGEEFAIILNNTSYDSALLAAQKIRTKVQNSKFTIHKGKDITLTISIGLSMFQNEDDLESIIKYADIALYQAKDNGRNQVQLDKRLLR